MCTTTSLHRQPEAPTSCTTNLRHQLRPQLQPRLCDPKQSAIMFIYNPETIVRVSLIFLEQRLEYLIAQKRFTEAIDLLDKAKG